MVINFILENYAFYAKIQQENDSEIQFSSIILRHFIDLELIK
ncbi:MAG: hypothetical protein ACFE9V_19150 [Candidatus Hodarchaeota archaeon]